MYSNSNALHITLTLARSASASYSKLKHFTECTRWVCAAHVVIVSWIQNNEPALVAARTMALWLCVSLKLKYLLFSMNAKHTIGISKYCYYYYYYHRQRRRDAYGFSTFSLNAAVALVFCGATQTMSLCTVREVQCQSVPPAHIVELMFRP